MAVAWAALGILTAFSLGVLGIFVSLLSRFDRQNHKFDALNVRIDKSDAEHRAAIDALGDRITVLGDRINSRFDNVNSRIDTVNSRIDESDAEHRAAIDTLGDRIERRIDDHETRRHAG